MLPDCQLIGIDEDPACFEGINNRFGERDRFKLFGDRMIMGNAVTDSAYEGLPEPDIILIRHQHCLKVPDFYKMALRHLSKENPNRRVVISSYSSYEHEEFKQGLSDCIELDPTRYAFKIILDKKMPFNPNCSNDGYILIIKYEPPEKRIDIPERHYEKQNPFYCL